MPYIIENLTQYDLTQDEADRLEAFGFIFANTTENPDPEARETTALVWDDFGLEGDRAFDLFDAVLGRRQT